MVNAEPGEKAGPRRPRGDSEDDLGDQPASRRIRARQLRARARLVRRDRDLQPGRHRHRRGGRAAALPVPGGDRPDRRRRGAAARGGSATSRTSAGSTSTGGRWGSSRAGCSCRCSCSRGSGWIIATTAMFVAATLAFCERRVLIERPDRPGPDRGDLRRLQLRPRPRPAQRHGHRRHARRAGRRRVGAHMETLAALGTGFLVALTPMNLLLVGARRDRRHRDRRAARHRAGADRGAALCRSPPASTRPPPSSCSAASTTAPCTAARPPRSC